MSVKQNKSNETQRGQTTDETVTNTKIYPADEGSSRVINIATTIVKD
jgi:hypothetical protein